jgi:NAD(P)-dependent dehydrogenase (short-subunit alcohol dehydrogenase family)
MDLNLKGKVVLVTGGASGIGEAIVWAAAKEGAIPAIVGRTAEKGEKLVAELKKKGHESYFYQCELSREEDCVEVVDHVLEKYNRIDHLVNNAGFNDGVGLENGTPQAFMNSLYQNLFHYYTMAHYALPALKATQGSIVNISSKTAVTGQGGTSGYVASKAGQLGLTREWAVELLPFGIRVNAILPAEVMTPLYASWIQKFDNPEEKLRQITAKIPLGNRMTTSKEIAHMALFLMSDRASHITGQHLYVDGGYTHLDRSIS